MLSFILVSYLLKTYLEGFLQVITNQKWKTVYTVLIIATLIGIPFVIVEGVGWVEILFSYALGTSLHELIFKWIEKLFDK